MNKPTLNPIRRLHHRRRAVALVAASGTIYCAAASAHDSWLLPAEFVVAANQPVRVAFCTGEHFPASEAAAAPDRVAEFVAASSKSRAPISGFAPDANDLAASVTLAEPGLHAISIALNPKFIEIDAEGFTEYLRDEHAGQALKLRVSREQSDKPGRELYTKLAKTYVRVNGAAAADTREIDAKDIPSSGHKLEIIPQSDPTSLRAGNIFRVQVVFDGAPLNNARVKLGRQGLPPHTYAAKADTDGDGFAEFKFSDAGLWYLRTHAIRPLQDSTEADWESFWAALTVKVSPR